MQPLPGFRDFLPEPLPGKDAWSFDLRRHIAGAWGRVARRYGFREYDGPPLEPLELYTLKSGDEIVQQLFNFTDKGGREVALRPEMTPTLARMVAAVEKHYRKPIRWFAIPQLFRYEKQQKGRLREHFQFNADIFGEADPGADAELIALLIDALRELGLTAEDFVVRLSSRQAWQGFFARHGADPAQAYVFFQIIDKLERQKSEVTEEGLRALGISLADVREFIAAGEPTPELRVVMGSLAARGLGEFVRIDYGVIRGLAYYTGVVFEAFDRKGEFRAIAGGGRYDQLVRQVSGGKVDLPGLGFGMGDVVLAELLKARGLVPRFDGVLDVYVLIEDESLREESLRLVQALRDAGAAVEFPLAAVKADKQFRRALDLGARRTVRFERSTANTPQARIKDLTTRVEEVVSAGDVIDHLRQGFPHLASGKGLP